MDTEVTRAVCGHNSHFLYKQHYLPSFPDHISFRVTASRLLKDKTEETQVPGVPCMTTGTQPHAAMAACLLLALNMYVHDKFCVAKPSGESLLLQPVPTPVHNGELREKDKGLSKVNKYTEAVWVQLLTSLY